MSKYVQLLTDDIMKDMLGDNHQGIVYYNYDLGRWNRESYMGIDLRSANMAAMPWLNTARETLELNPLFSRWHVVALVSMLVEGYDYPGMAKNCTGVKKSVSGNAIVSKIVCRNKRTGKIEPVSQNWVGSGHFIYPEHAIHAMPTGLARRIYDNAALRVALIEDCVKKR